MEEIKTTTRKMKKRREREKDKDDNYDSLVELKRRFDPDNVFHVNQNIAP